jgi:hypothetical protein
MIVHPRIAETAIAAGTGVVQGAKENTVKSPASNGGGDYVGVFAYDPKKPQTDAGETVGVVLSGVVKVLAGGNVTAGKKAVLKADASGAFIDLPAAAGTYQVCGLFLQSGEADEYVEMMVERGSVTIA